MTIQECVEQIREIADRLEESINPVAIEPGMSLGAAVEECCRKFGVFELVTAISRYGAGDRVQIRYRVWDGNKSHEGATLASAMAIAVASNETEATIEQAEAELAGKAVPA